MSNMIIDPSNPNNNNNNSNNSIHSPQSMMQQQSPLQQSQQQLPPNISPGGGGIAYLPIRGNAAAAAAVMNRDYELPNGLSAGSCGVGYDPNREGPPGANLFIYNIPKTYGDLHLYHAFERFGTILSAKVFIDKPSGTTRGFGFVSFGSPESAQMAIREMNGKTLEGRKIKVEIKRRDANDDNGK